ncbi:Gfo/Idh/MocA family protein [Kutzneria kofuensis]|uniref:Putative dehydrogenase n=1 Tax=Kutzneria kofuensis TaxID=103725 RepID=A0A7W9KRW3_9PSEU|nr:Gfo/Idh/MocA family oxidoreductase [Kutzneria kofuensis]MBB5897599.1 putative dehydrogenase [Kutzneria kofuensis]
MTATPIRLGVIGLGVMGRRTFDQALQHPDFVVTRAADANPAVVAALRAEHPDVAFVAPTEVVDGVDAIYVATPPSLHAQYALQALRAGVAVFCEKPLAVDLAEGREMVAAGGVTAVNFPLSNTNATLYLEKAIPDAGRLLGVDVRMTFPQWPRPFQAPAAWVGERAEGGFIREVFSHFAYLTDRLVGPVRTVQATVDYPAEGSEVAARGLLRAGDVSVQVSGYAGVAAAESYEWILWGTKRSYRLRNWVHLSTSDGGPWTPVELSGDGTGAESTRLSLFAQAIRGTRPADLADFADALRVQEAVEAFYA